MSQRPLTFALLGCLAASLWSLSSRAEAPGLHVRDGIILLGEKPYRAVGVNYFSLFSRLLENPRDTSSLDQLKKLKSANIPFVRFMAGGFWPKDWALYQHDPKEYFRRLDLVVHAAEQAQIGLIPSLFWHYPTIPDLVGEPIDQLGNPDSQSIAFIRTYTKQIVSRYKDSPAIYAWEFGNEYTLSADLPNAPTQRPQIVPELGTPKSRTARDQLTSKAALAAMTAFAKEARRLDPHRILLSGNAIPRISAFHNTSEKSWKPDTADQFQQILLRDNPSPINTLTVHLYPPPDHKFPAPARDMSDLIHNLAAIARDNKKPLFIGEFGAVQIGEDHPSQRQAVAQILDAIEKEQIPLAALWVFDLDSQNDALNVTFDNPRKDLLDLISKSNEKSLTNHVHP